MEIQIGSHWITDVAKTPGKLVLREHKYVYIPILNTIQQLLKDDSVLTEVRFISGSFIFYHFFDRSFSHITLQMSFYMISVMDGKQKNTI